MIIAIIRFVIIIVIIISIINIINPSLLASILSNMTIIVIRLNKNIWDMWGPRHMLVIERSPQVWRSRYGCHVLKDSRLNRICLPQVHMLFG